MKKNVWIWIVVLILLTGVFVGQVRQGKIQPGDWYYALTGQTPEEESSLTAMAANSALKPGTEAPSFALMGLDGALYQVGGPRDKVLLLNFWASWCEPCKEEAPDLVSLSEQYKDQLDIYAVNVTLYDQLEDAKSFVQEYGYTFPVLLDEKETIYRLYGGIAFPTNILIDRDGVIRDVIVGSLSKKDLEAKIKKWL